MINVDAGNENRALPDVVISFSLAQAPSVEGQLFRRAVMTVVAAAVAAFIACPMALAGAGHATNKSSSGGYFGHFRHGSTWTGPRDLRGRHAGKARHAVLGWGFADPFIGYPYLGYPYAGLESYLQCMRRVRIETLYTVTWRPVWTCDSRWSSDRTKLNGLPN